MKTTIGDVVVAKTPKNIRKVAVSRNQSGTIEAYQEGISGAKIKAQRKLYLQHPKITRLISIRFRMLAEEQAELPRKFLISNESKLIQEKLGWYAIMYIILSLSLSII